MSPEHPVSTSAERAELIESLARHRGFLLATAEGLTEEQARTASTVSELTIASILKHVADTEEQWMDFAVRGSEAFAGDGVYESDVDWDAVDAQAAARGGDGADGEWEDTRFVLGEDDTLDRLRARIAEVAARTEGILATGDLEAGQVLPEAPWFPPATTWSLRRIALHMIAEISHHNGHADIIREAIDGKKMMG